MQQEGLKEGYDNLLRRLGVELSCCENNPLPRHVAVLDAETPFFSGTVLEASKFRLYNRAEISLFENYSSNVIQSTRFHSKKLVIIAHGYTENGDAEWLREMAKELVKVEDMNVVTVNWGDIVGGFYHTAVNNMYKAENRILDLLTNLVAKKSQKTVDIHLIGVSLGAQLMGKVGRKMKDQGIMVDRITGLDPAGPLFEKRHARDRLDAAHASFVDVIHTDTRTITLNPLIKISIPKVLFKLGTKRRLGDSDFYPNDGYNQPGCKKITLPYLLNPFIPMKDRIERLICSHARSVYYYIESIKNKNAFQAKRCSHENIFLEREKQGDKKCSYYGNQMGYYTKRIPGVYYVKTKSSSPFSCKTFKAISSRIFDMH